ncbi:Glycoside hydrolase family 28 protein [Rasamsonia emersonii CBS 393.64]|uniref:galacturonan 1,4-alpha-galacturonidase n=1 Tax=Rasamsonia emersonii (strain ATCC 16479 / CBS 393.64 / IMI 116815) TaxID=1408163 RepID=A0A0F4Z586_RASE3|nr:Glycoside hydrolase family 28 protein [Rasamsonia emersonii CBS 393.64]KKA25505.1 Glycoside hydrolase family 28 protein [Rasamsonia emersonii CBS 393.64]
MKVPSSVCFFLAGLASTALATTTPTHPAGNNPKTCIIPAKGTGEDDSPAIRDAFAACSTNGHIIFQPNQTYHLNTVLQLHNLSHVQVDLLGTLLYSTDVRYWIQHGSYYHFQNISIAMELSGEYITVDGHGTGVIDGQGQVWYDLALGVGGLFGRPIPFSLRNAKHSVAQNFHIRQSGKWNFVIIESQNITVDNIRLTAHSDDFQANPGNLGNTDGFDTLYSDDVHISNSYVDAGDDCVSFKPGSTNIHVKNLTCVETAGIAVGSLGQYEGVFDLVENITAEDVTLINSRNGAYIKTYNGKRVYYPPQGGGNGTGSVRNVLFKNFHIQNITAAPVLLQQCTHWAGWGVPPCAEYPATGFTFSNITWQNFTGYANEKINTTTISLVCSEKSSCEDFTLTDINVRPWNNATATGVCTNVKGLSSDCQVVSG